MSAQQEPVRILQVVTSMGRGGVETLLMNLYRAIDRNRYQFDFLLHRETRSDYDDEIEQLGGRIYRFAPLRVTDFLQYQRTATRFFREHPEYEIVHSHINTFSLMPLRAAQAAGVPIRIAHAHTGSMTYTPKGLIKFTCRMFLNRYVTYRLTCSDKAARWVFGRYAEQAEFFSNGIDTQRFRFREEIRDKVRRENHWNEKLVLGSVANFIPVKNHFFMLDILAELKKLWNNPVVLILVGSGKVEEERAIRKKVDQLNLQNDVFFFGVRRDVEQLMQGMDAYLIPSLYEGLPLATVEAQSSGLPVFASDTVSKDLRMTPFCYFLPLSKGAHFWAEQILERCHPSSRTDGSSLVLEHGFDIHENAERLMILYEQLRTEYSTRPLL